MAAGSVFALTAAGVGSLGTLSGGDVVHVTNTGTISSITTTSCKDAIAVSYTTSNNTITDVVLTIASPSTCTTSNLASVVLSNGDAYTRSGGPTAFTGTTTLTATVHLGTAFDYDTNTLASTALTVS